MILPKHIIVLPPELHRLWLEYPVRFMDWFVLKGPGYQWASSLGIAFFFPAVYYWHHTCHVKGCFWPGHIDPAVGHPSCSKHHSLGHLHGVDQSKESTP